MKKHFIRYLPGSILAIALFTNVHAQFAKASLEMNAKEYIYNEARANLALDKEVNAANVHTRALKDFGKNYKDAAKANWIRIQDGFVAKVKEVGVDIKVYYDRKGRWNATIRTYDEGKLPKDIRKIVKSTYYDYSITQINEVTVGDKTAYLVRVEDQETFKTIRIIDGEMDVYEDFKKS
jgi:hypothetical protein